VLLTGDHWLTSCLSISTN